MHESCCACWCVMFCLFAAPVRCCYQYTATHIEMSHVTHLNESWCKYEWVMSHSFAAHARYCQHIRANTGMSQVTHTRISHDAHMTESYHTDDRVMSHVWMSHVIFICSAHAVIHVTCMNESCHTYKCRVTNLYVTYMTVCMSRMNICDTFEFRVYMWFICDIWKYVTHLNIMWQVRMSCIYETN